MENVLSSGRWKIGRSRTKKTKRWKSTGKISFSESYARKKHKKRKENSKGNYSIRRTKLNWMWIERYLPKVKVLWEAFYGNGESVKILKRLRFEVVSNEEEDFYKGNGSVEKCDTVGSEMFRLTNVQNPQNRQKQSKLFFISIAKHQSFILMLKHFFQPFSGHEKKWKKILTKKLSLKCFFVQTLFFLIFNSGFWLV